MSGEVAVSGGGVAGTTYAAAGVDVDAGERAVELMKASVAKAQRPEVIGGLGGFAGLFDASALKSYDQPLLATSADGVGTKVAIACPNMWLSGSRFRKRSGMNGRA